MDHFCRSDPGLKHCDFHHKAANLFLNNHADISYFSVSSILFLSWDCPLKRRLRSSASFHLASARRASSCAASSSEESSRVRFSSFFTCWCRDSMVSSRSARISSEIETFWNKKKSVEYLYGGEEAFLTHFMYIKFLKRLGWIWRPEHLKCSN